MSQSVYDEWGSLCEEFDAARKADFDAFVVVSRRFQAFGAPSEEELREWDVAKAKLKDVKIRMRAFAERQ
jgi:hypothetical protein